MKRIGTNKFVQRQVAASPFSHFDGSWTELEQLVDDNFEYGKPGYRDGVLLVMLAPQGFHAGVVEVTATTELVAKFTKRRPDEAAFLEVLAKGPKLPAQAVDVVLYRRDLLVADGDASTDAEWEIISINARPTFGTEPLTPIAMARNFLGRVGGTQANYTAEEFAKSIEYWSTRAMRAE